MNPPATGSENTESTFWEVVATTRWGSHISDRERAAILEADRLAGSPGTVLDVGCDGGRWSRFLADRGWQPICIDVDPESVETCALRLPEATCICLDKDYDRLPCEDQSVNLVLCIEVPPVLYSKWFLPECRRVLDPDGLLVTVFWNRGSVRGRFASARARRHRTYDYYPKRYVEWMEEVSDAGFREVWSEGLCWAPFARDSDSAFVTPAVRLEHALGLRKLTRYAPWVVSVLRLVR